METKRDLLEGDFKVLLQIFETTKLHYEMMTLSKLLDIFDGRISENRISQSLDRLYDEGMLRSHYTKIGNKWACVYYITIEAENFVKNIYNETVKN